MERELCDIQNEEASKHIKQPPTLIKYEMSQGPNPDFHDDGISPLERVVLNEQKGV